MSTLKKEAQKQNDTNQDVVSIVYVDDDVLPGKIVKKYLEALDCCVRLFTDPKKCLNALKEEPADIVITDLEMPQINGLEVLKSIKDKYPSTEVIIATGAADKGVAIKALKLGAYDFFEKPVNKDELLASITRTIRYQALLKDHERLSQQLSFISEREAIRWGLKAFIGKSQSITKVADDIRMLQETDRTSVLVMGESGTGKELVARAIHTGGRRCTNPFIPINCSAIPDNLAESILFGHVRGSFTGATADKKGAFEVAEGGTIFLDEIGDMSPAIQVKLLRVLEDGVVTPVGSAKGRKIDARVIAATNVDLDTRIQAGAFRMDLYYRLATFTVNLPALRDRKGDIGLLVDYFVESLSSEMGKPKPTVSKAAMTVLESNSFPGNVRELRNVIEQALIRSRGAELMPAHISLRTDVLPALSQQKADNSQIEPPPDNLPLDLASVEQIAIKRAMQKVNGNVSEAARLLGISRNKLYRILPTI